MFSKGRCDSRGAMRRFRFTICEGGAGRRIRRASASAPYFVLADGTRCRSPQKRSIRGDLRTRKRGQDWRRRVGGQCLCVSGEERCGHRQQGALRWRRGGRDMKRTRKLFPQVQRHGKDGLARDGNVKGNLWLGLSLRTARATGQRPTSQRVASLSISQPQAARSSEQRFLPRTTLSVRFRAP